MYIFLMASDDNAAKTALIEIGYPDRNWPTEQDMQKSGSLQASQRDTQRRNDLARIDTSLVQYQTNNAGKLPMGPSYWEGEATFNCADANVACKFVRDYMNNSTENTFTDPDGTPYSLYITENWFENGTITPNFGNSDSDLIEVNERYTIGSESTKHVIYVIPGGECGENNNIVKSDSARHFAAMYRLEKNGIYCMDDR